MKIFSKLIFIFLVFCLCLEALSYMIIFFDIKIPRSVNTKSPFSLHTWDEVKTKSTENSRIGEIARVLEKWSTPEIRSLKAPDVSLREMPSQSISVGKKTRKDLFTNLGLASNLDDEFSIDFAHTGIEKIRGHYTTDENARRITGTESLKNPKLNILVVGCSYTFGYGVNNPETFPAILAKKLHPLARVYNFGTPGASPASFLYRLNLNIKEFLGGIDKSLPTIVIYVYIPDQLNRVVGTSLWFARHSSVLNTPEYGLTGDTISYRGFFSDNKINDLLYIFGKSSFAEVTQIEIPFLGEKQFELFGAVLENFKQQVVGSFNISEFHVTNYPSEDLNFHRVMKVLNRKNVSTWDLTGIDMSKLLNDNYRLQHDTHPSKLGNEVFSELLVHQISKNQLFKKVTGK